MVANDASSLQSAGQVTISFRPDYQKVKLHVLKLTRGNDTLDRLNSVKVRFLQREAELEQNIYTGEVTASMLINDLRVGDVVEYSYSLVGANPVFQGLFADAASWDHGPPVDLRRVAVTYPADRKIAWKHHGPPGSRPVTGRETVKDKLRTLVFEESPVTEVEFEPFTPADIHPVRWLQFSEFEAWRDVARWADGLFPTKTFSNTELHSAIARIKKTSSIEEQTAAALAHVQSEIRYVSESLGESSHRPAEPDVVMTRRYGDCKDKSFLLITMLRELGISAQPVLVNVRSPRATSSLLPSPLDFDHVIVLATIGNARYFLDPTRTTQTSRLESMGQVHERAEALVVSTQSDSLTTIRRFRRSSSYSPTFARSSNSLSL